MVQPITTADVHRGTFRCQTCGTELPVFHHKRCPKCDTEFTLLSAMVQDGKPEKDDKREHIKTYRDSTESLF